jgi:hypothetical protein
MKEIKGWKESFGRSNFYSFVENFSVRKIFNSCCYYNNNGRLMAVANIANGRNYTLKENYNGN